MSRTNHLGIYVSDAEQTRLEREAEQADLSLSGYIVSIIEAHWDDTDTGEAADRMDAEEKIERAANEALQEIEDTACHTEQRVDDLADMVARSGSYSVANFELLKHQHGPPEGTKTDALRVGSRRLRAPLSDHPDLLDSEDGSEDDANSLAVKDAENADDDDDDEDEELSASERFFKGRGRSKEEVERTSW